MTAAELKSLVLNKYMELKSKNIWGSKSREEEQIVVLSAHLNRTKYVNLKLASAVKAKL